MNLVPSKQSILLLSVSLLCMLSGCQNAEQNTKQPNVIIILTDDQGYGDMACHGNPWLKTPAMDMLHDESVELTDFHVDPTCAPTRAAIMTGRYSARSGVWLTYGSRHHMRKNETTMAQVFQQNGYKTAIFGKWHLGDNYPFRPEDRGFDESLIHGGGVVGETPDYWDNNYYNDVYFRNGKPEKVQGYCTDVWFNETKRFVSENKDKPFFIYLSTNAPHGPLHVAQKYVKPYLNRDSISKKRAYFYGMLANIDENLAKLRSHLKNEGVDRNTILIYFNDNGTNTGVTLSTVDGNKRNGWTIDGYNAGMRGMKVSAFEGGHRAACFMHYPEDNWTGGKQINGVSSHIDLLPTLIDACHLQFEEKLPLDGISLLPAIHGNSGYLKNRTVIVHDQGRFGKALGDGPLIKYKDYSVMRNTWRLVGEELFNLATDPSQKQDIADENPALVKELKAEYEKWWADVSKNSDRVNPFVVDPNKQKVVSISSQNLLGGEVAYSQRMVRQGMPASGFTYIDVEVPGTYTISLSRFAKEADLALDQKAPPYPMDPSTHYPMRIIDKALSFTQARLHVGDFDKTVSVVPGQKQVNFKVELKKGYQKIQTWMTLENGTKVAAYYCYIAPAK